MKGLKEFIEDLAKNNKLREKFKDLKDVKEIVKLAKKEGYEFTEDEYMDKQMENVSGGALRAAINTEITEEMRKKAKQGLSTKPYNEPGLIVPSRLNIPIENVTVSEAMLKFLKGNE